MAEHARTIRKMPEGATLYAKVQLAKPLVIRLWLGTTLMKLAAWIMQCDVEIEGPN